MNNTQLKQLAEMTVQDGQVNRTVAEFVMTKLNRTQLKTYVMYLKNELIKDKVNVKTSEMIDQETEKQFQSLFAEKELQFETDEALGAGIYVKAGDTIIDLTMKNYINQTVNQLKDEV